MAREQITHNRIIPPLPVAPDEPGAMPEQDPPALVWTEEARRNLHVQWHREGGWVQVAVELTVAEIRELLAHAEREAAAAAKAHEHFGEYATEQHQVMVFSDTLDRAEVNKAITALRRGRDVAYGKDA